MCSREFEFERDRVVNIEVPEFLSPEAMSKLIGACDRAGANNSQIIIDVSRHSDLPMSLIGTLVHMRRAAGCSADVFLQEANQNLRALVAFADRDKKFKVCSGKCLCS